MLSTIRRNRITPLAIAALASALAFPSATKAQNQAVILNPPSPAATAEKQAPAVEKHLKTFDELDFDVFSNQKWARLQESHAKDIVVTWPDGHETKGIEKHIEDLKAMFVYAPDIQIKAHPIRFGSGSWTTATGVMTGTFSKPMPIGNGKFIRGCRRQSFEPASRVIGQPAHRTTKEARQARRHRGRHFRQQLTQFDQGIGRSAGLSHRELVAAILRP